MNNLCASAEACQNNVSFSDTMFQVKGFLNQSLSKSQSVTSKCIRSLQSVANLVTILNSLPELIVNASYRSIVSLISNVMCIITYQIVRVIRNVFPNRQEIQLVLNMEANDYKRPVQSKPPYLALYASFDLIIPIANILFQALSSPSKLQNIIKFSPPEDIANYGEYPLEWYHNCLS